MYLRNKTKKGPYNKSYVGKDFETIDVTVFNSHILISISQQHYRHSLWQLSCFSLRSNKIISTTILPQNLPDFTAMFVDKQGTLICVFSGITLMIKVPELTCIMHKNW